MSFPSGSGYIICQSCGTAWRADDMFPSHHFRSASFKTGSYASAKDIADASEDMLYCPKDDFKGHLGKITEDMNDFRKGTMTAEGRFPDVEERANQGDADVVHTP
jgi:hypothetical protein